MGVPMATTTAILPLNFSSSMQRRGVAQLVGGELNPKRGGEDTRAGSQGMAICGDAPPGGNDAGSSPLASAGAADSSN